MGRRPRSYSGAPAVQRDYTRGPVMDAAAHVALIARRFTQKRANAVELTEACRWWLETQPDANKEPSEPATGERDDGLSRSRCCCGARSAAAVT